LYSIKDFYCSDRIAIIARGASAAYVCQENDFDDCFLVGQFVNAFKDEQLAKCLLCKNIVQVVNKSSIKTDRPTCERFNILDLQCNFAPDKKGNLSPAKTRVYNRIVSKNRHLKVHLGPRGIKERRVKPPKSWATTGLYAVDLAAFFHPKEIWTFGVDFYESGYFSQERIHVSIESNKKRKKDMIKNLYGIVRRDSDIDFHVYTSSNSLESMNNLYIHKV